jgi:HAD superfamily hydrolase (TIGR01509 family)
VGLNKTFRALLCDLDGTLVDTERLHYAAICKVYGGFGVPLSFLDQNMYVFIGRGLSVVHDFIAGAYALPLAVADIALSINTAVQEVLMHEGINPSPHALDVLKEIPLPKMVVSNGHSTHVDYSLSTTGLKNFFEGVVTPCMGYAPKPSPDLYLAAAARLNILPESCLVIEDTVVGITAAKQAGMNVIGYYGLHQQTPHYPKVLEQAGADMISDNWRVIGKLITNTLTTGHFLSMVSP